MGGGSGIGQSCKKDREMLRVKDQGPKEKGESRLLRDLNIERRMEELSEISVEEVIAD